MNSAARRYHQLQQRLLRAQRTTDASGPAMDALLDEMDRVWDDLTEDERYAASEAAAALAGPAALERLADTGSSTADAHPKP